MSERNIGHSPDSSFRISSAWLCRRLDNGGCLGVLLLVFCPMFSSKHRPTPWCSLWRRCLDTSWECDSVPREAIMAESDNTHGNEP